MMTFRRPRARGFTLTELLAGLAVMAVLGAIAAPAFSSIVANIRARGAGSDLYASLALARGEAIKRNAEVTLAPVTAGKWQDGWAIADPANQGRKLENRAAIKGGTITGPDSVVFLPNGRVKGGASPKFDIAVAGSDQHRCISVDLGGRPNQTNGTCS